MPNWTYLEDFRQSDEKFKRNQGLNYNHRHRVRALNDLPDGTEVWVQSGDSQTKGHIITPANTPRSYLNRVFISALGYNGKMAVAKLDQFS